MSQYEFLSLLIGIAGVLVAGIAASIYYIQLRKMASSILIAQQQLKSMAQSVEQAARANSLTVLTLEEATRRSREKLADISTKVESYKDVELAKKAINEAIENYLNSLDRLCACIRRGHVPEDEYRKDYRDVIKQTIKNYKSYFGPGTSFTNILKLNEKWSEE
ncbi:hypothetical protein AF332_15100 [Sporosarcina globispora]|uniref:Uncharacterized protein n=1 Tax=Sporosarcina globispora TaxID=1459 RepID=A0A0M0GF09_SPOGL|nr:hypothetical protein [Sporosarcina globispora]KON88016.1 hypothetical protein AF332_15100 [Sporosarcina globispora]